MGPRTDKIYQLAYDELRSLARYYLHGDRAGKGFRPTELVNEAVSRLHGKVEFGDEKHLIATVAQAMRRVLVDAARERSRARHGDGLIQVTLGGEMGLVDDRTIEVLMIDDAISRLSKKSARVSEVAEMTIFGGLTQDEIASHFKVSKRTIVKDWAMARGWLVRELDLQPTKRSQPKPTDTDSAL